MGYVSKISFVALNSKGNRIVFVKRVKDSACVAYPEGEYADRVAISLEQYNKYSKYAMK